MQSKNTALTLAAAWGHTDVVQVLLSQQDLNIGLRNKVIVHVPGLMHQLPRD